MGVRGLLTLSTGEEHSDGIISARLVYLGATAAAVGVTLAAGFGGAGRAVVVRGRRPRFGNARCEAMRDT